ncbi:hypothetical protein [Vibrio sp.]|uniref:hypothetical protein n=1 Tax=Vibrio sp. TaxID=678 RepID=UPI003F6B20AA
MNLTSLTLASSLRTLAMLGVVTGLLLAYHGEREKALFKQTTSSVMQAMDKQIRSETERTGCLHMPIDDNINTLVSEGWLDPSIQDNSPWVIDIAYQASRNSGRVIGKHLTLTARTPQGALRLNELAQTVIGSWRFQGQTLTLLDVVKGPTDVSRMEFDPATACFAW